MSPISLRIKKATVTAGLKWAPETGPKTTISTTAHGIPHTINNNQDCILVEPANPNLLSESILELINDEKKCERLGISSHQTVLETCNSENMVKNVLTMYDQLIKEKSKSGII